MAMPHGPRDRNFTPNKLVAQRVLKAVLLYSLMSIAFDGAATTSPVQAYTATTAAFVGMVTSNVQPGSYTAAIQGSPPSSGCGLLKPRSIIVVALNGG